MKTLCGHQATLWQREVDAEIIRKYVEHLGRQDSGHLILKL